MAAEIADLSQGIEHMMTRCLALALEHQTAIAADQQMSSADNKGDEEHEQEESEGVEVELHADTRHSGEATLLPQQPSFMAAAELDLRQAFMDDEVTTLNSALSVLGDDAEERRQALSTETGRRVVLTRSEQVLYFDVLSLLTEPEPVKSPSQVSSGMAAIPVEQLLQTFAGREAAMVGLIQKGERCRGVAASVKEW